MNDIEALLWITKKYINSWLSNVSPGWYENSKYYFWTGLAILSAGTVPKSVSGPYVTSIAFHSNRSPKTSCFFPSTITPPPPYLLPLWRQRPLSNSGIFNEAPAPTFKTGRMPSLLRIIFCACTCKFFTVNFRRRNARCNERKMLQIAWMSNTIVIWWYLEWVYIIFESGSEKKLLRIKCRLTSNNLCLKRKISFPIYLFGLVVYYINWCMYVLP